MSLNTIANIYMKCNKAALQTERKPLILL